MLTVIDGLTPSALEQGLEAGRLPTLALLVERGRYVHGVSTFPSVTPVCLTSIATGSSPDVHGIPHLVWYHRDEQRIVEYGSSLAAVRAAGLRGTIRDSAIDMSGSHLSPDALTVFEVLEDAGLVTGAINFTCYRGRIGIASGSPAWRAGTAGTSPLPARDASSSSTSTSPMRPVRRSRCARARPAPSTPMRQRSADGS